jgi:hypothetical protein
MATIDDLNYLRDPRNCKRDPERIYVFEETDDGEVEHEIPTRWAVCPVCEGKGSHVNPSIDSGGLTGEDFANDPEFMEDYFSGQYDQPCNRCGGRTTVRAVDRDACPVDLLALYDADEQAAYDMEAERLAEIRAGA